MPSRKKAQRRARKAEKKKRAAEAKHASCRHLPPSDGYTDDDWIASENLSTEMKSAVDVLFWSQQLNGHEYMLGLFVMMQLVYDKYHLFSEVGKKLFRERMLALGTEECIKKASETDLVKETSVAHAAILHAAPYVWMIQTIEVRDKYDGALNKKIYTELETPVNDICVCPRVTVRFFHRRNSCDCLQDIYYKLKENTKRTSVCVNCSEVRDIRTMVQQCECERMNYCSEDCAKAHWPEHKADCKLSKKVQE